jgi:pimeloyl-ACP methyl ester carboxylesterase
VTTSAETTDEALVASLPGFTNARAQVNGIGLHYVHGGDGHPLVLLPSWPKTWWEFHHVMPALAERHHVIAVDYRGMGTSDKPASGYDKKAMAADIHTLLTQLGVGPAVVVGSDIGAMIAYSVAANHPQTCRALVMLDAPHPFPAFGALPLLPPPGAYDLAGPQRLPHPWWFAFNQIHSLPEQLLEGRYHLLQHWLFDYLTLHSTSIDSHDRAVYAQAYATADAIRAANGWYQSFHTDIADLAGYRPLTLPVLAAGSSTFDFLAAFASNAAPDARTVKLADAGHWIADEAPGQLLDLLDQFLPAADR